MDQPCRVRFIKMKNTRSPLVSITNMNCSRKIIVLVSLYITGCGTIPVSKTPLSWPKTVAETCPTRRVPLECFRKPSIRKAMAVLSDTFQDCHRTNSGSLMVSLKIETEAGRPTCVESTPKHHPLAACATRAVAHHLKIPESADDERCQFRYPIRFN